MVQKIFELENEKKEKKRKKLDNNPEHKYE